jgi:hypothetical protein
MADLSKGGKKRNEEEGEGFLPGHLLRKKS